MDKIDRRCEKILFSHQQIVAACKKAAKWIDKKFKNKKLTIVGVLNGSVPFIAELIKHITIDFRLRFVEYHSYFGGVVSVSKTNVVVNLKVDVDDNHVLLVDDVVDTGWTMSNLKNALLMENNAKSVSLMSLIDKPSKHEVPLEDFYSCFKLENKFVVGFGLDYQEFMRGIPYIGIIKKSIYEKELKKAKQNQKNKSLRK